MQQRVRIVGAREAVADVIAELERVIVEKHGSISISDPHPVPTGLGARAPYGQMELVDVLATIAINLASSALYDLVKAAIARAQQSHSIEIHVDVHIDGTSDTTTDAQ